MPVNDVGEPGAREPHARFDGRELETELNQTTATKKNDPREGRWRPLPSRRVFIPKPGSSEQRPLSIPNQSQTAATNATISVESGYSPSLFDSVIAFPFASSTPILAPGQMSSGGNLRPKFGLPANMIAVN